MLELAILGLLKERAMHGYQLKKRLADTLGSFWQVSYGSLYPALRRLQKQEAVEMIFPKEEVGRRKNVYRITQKGEEIFAELLERAGQDATTDDAFSVRLAFFKYLKPETRIRLLEPRPASGKGACMMTNEPIRLAIVGAGNCASALVQGLEFYKDASPGDQVPGLMHVQLGPYHVRDVQVVAAFDVDGKKVGRDVSEAIFAEPNNTIRFADVAPLGVG